MIPRAGEKFLNAAPVLPKHNKVCPTKRNENYRKGYFTTHFMMLKIPSYKKDIEISQKITIVQDLKRQAAWQNTYLALKTQALSLKTDAKIINKILASHNSHLKLVLEHQVEYIAQVEYIEL